MSARHRSRSLGPEAFRAGPPQERTALRDHLEYFAVLILTVLLLRQVVVEAFRIQHGSMAPTLVGMHNEVRCPNCGWVFDVGQDKVSGEGEVECPNCRYHWAGASAYDEDGALLFKQPAAIWNSATTQAGQPLASTDAANRVPRRASRIFVNKFIYRLRKPRRWEVVVFLYPGYSARCTDCGWQGDFVSTEDVICPDCGLDEFEFASKNFIKRVVGMPGETVQLRHGDLYVDGQMARKPPHVQERMWFHVFDSAFTPRREIVPTWDLGAGTPAWSQDREAGTLTVNALGATEPVMAAFARTIVDFYAYDGLSFQTASRGGLGATGRNEVGDVRIRALVRVLDAEPGAEVALGIREGGREFSFGLGVGARGGATLRDGGREVGRAGGAALSLGQARWMALENYDDRVVCRLDGREVLSRDYASAGGLRGAELRFGARGARVAFERIIIERDIYYENAEDHRAVYPVYELGDQEYFVLGDNSPASLDSRSSRWPEPGVPAQNLIGRAFFVFWPVHQMKWLPRGEPAGGGAEPAPPAP